MGVFAFTWPRRFFSNFLRKVVGVLTLDFLLISSWVSLLFSSWVSLLFFKTGIAAVRKRWRRGSRKVPRPGN